MIKSFPENYVSKETHIIQKTEQLSAHKFSNKLK